jgi:hypothetical protein
MRFHYGAIPEEAEFDPQAKGWASIREPGPLLLNVLGVPAALLMAVIAIGLVSLARKGGPQAIWRFAEGDPTTVPILPILAVIFLSIPLHELLHVFAHPHFGLSSDSVLGFWLSRGLFYAHFEGEMSRNRFLVVFAMPFLVLSLLPVVVIALIGESTSSMLPGYLVIVALVNSVLAAGDALGFVLMISQIPGTAVVRNKGWRSFWKHKAAGAA